MPQFLKSREALLGLAMVTIGLGFVFASLSIEILSEGAAPRVFPMAAASLIVALGILQIVCANDDPMERSTTEIAPLLALVALSIAYVLGITYVGYLVATAFAAPATFYLFGVRSKLGLAIAFVLCPIMYHLIFFTGLGVFPPYGLWFDLLDVIQGY